MAASRVAGARRNRPAVVISGLIIVDMSLLLAGAWHGWRSGALPRSAARAASVEAPEPVGIDLPASPPLDVLERAGQADVLDLRDTAADRADEVVVVVARGGTGHVGMLARGQVEALQDVQLGEEVECPKDRGAADAQAACSGVSDEVRGREVTAPRDDELGDREARLGQPMAGPVESRDQRLDGHHGGTGIMDRR